MTKVKKTKLKMDVGVIPFIILGAIGGLLLNMLVWKLVDQHQARVDMVEQEHQTDINEVNQDVAEIFIIMDQIQSDIEIIKEHVHD